MSRKMLLSVKNLTISYLGHHLVEKLTQSVYDMDVGLEEE